MQFYQTDIDKHIINIQRKEKEKNQIQLAQKPSILISDGGGLWNSAWLGILRSESREDYLQDYCLQV